MSFWTEGVPIMIAALAASAAICGGAIAAAKLARIDGLLARWTAGVPGPDVLIDQLSGMADLAKREGLLSLERHVQSLREPLLVAGVGMIIEGVPAARIMETIEAESCAEAATGPWPRRALAWLTNHPQPIAGLSAATLLVIFLSSRGDLMQTGQAAAAAGLGVLLVGVLGMAVVGSPERTGAGNEARRVLSGLVLAKGIAMIRQGMDGPAVRSGLMAMLPQGARGTAVRSKAA
jgi:chemotaxis protein MotA